MKRTKNRHNLFLVFRVDKDKNFVPIETYLTLPGADGAVSRYNQDFTERGITDSVFDVAIISYYEE